MSVPPEELRNAMRQWSSGVTIVTANIHSAPYGMTVSAFTSISLEPPLVIVSLRHDTRACMAASESGYFGVNILSSSQQELADCFSGRECEPDERFTGRIIHTLRSGAPFFGEALAWIDCHINAIHPAGQQRLIIGEVIAVKLLSEGLPLLYHNRSYRSLG